LIGRAAVRWMKSRMIHYRIEEEKGQRTEGRWPRAED